VPTRAHWLVVTRRSTKTTPPIAASSSQSGVAGRKRIRPGADGRSHVPSDRFPARIEPGRRMPRHGRYGVVRRCPRPRRPARPACRTRRVRIGAFNQAAGRCRTQTNARASGARTETAVQEDSSTMLRGESRPAATGQRTAGARIRLDTTAQRSWSPIGRGAATQSPRTSAPSCSVQRAGRGKTADGRRWR